MPTYQTMTPFTYIIGWPEHHRYYIGVRYARGCDPSDMWTRYFTSSPNVAAFAAIHGPPPYIDIIGTFETAKAAQDAEFAMLSQNDVIHLSWFINLRLARAINHTPEVRAKMKAKQSCRPPITEATRAAMKAGHKKRIDAGVMVGTRYPYKGEQLTVRAFAALVGRHKTTISEHLKKGRTFDEIAQLLRHPKLPVSNQSEPFNDLNKQKS